MPLQWPLSSLPKTNLPDRAGTRTIKLTLEYDGTEYEGFQRQRRGRTIQSTIEKALSELCQESIALVGGGRTDSGVHALAQVCHFKTSKKLEPSQILKGLNGLTPRDISIHRVEEVSGDFHARYSAIARRYAYFILNRPGNSAVFHRTIQWVPTPLDEKAMNKACRYLVGKKDFTSFCTSGSDRKNMITRIKKAWCVRGKNGLKVPFSHLDQHLITFYIEAENFLHNMVRIIVGTLLEIGQGKRKPEELKELIAKRDRKAAGPTAAPKGLFLLGIDYPKKIKPRKPRLK